jgi:flagellar basal-body rod modification protein FlgD
MATTSITAENPFLRANAMANGADASANSGTKPSTISSNDFLTLLVTEMKNQDPTSQTDPNQYVNQLVQVNSLEQLIEINENLSTALTASGSGGTGSGSGHAVTASGLHGAAAGLPAHSSAAMPTSSANSREQAVSHRISIPATSGNLSVPREIPAAHRVAHALSGRN